VRYDPWARAVGAAVRARRKALGMEAQAAAAKAGVTPETWSRIENGRHVPQDDTLARMAEVLGTTPEELLPRVLPAGRNEGKAVVSSSAAINRAEAVLLTLFRSLGPAEQARFVRDLAAMAAGVDDAGFTGAMIRDADVLTPA
jgi:transcriptional regulator with XRE-family HTH domain